VISIVIPSIKGREKSLARCRAAYLATSPSDAEYIIVHNKPNWPTACNAGYSRATFDRIHFTADDLEPLPGWWQEATAWMDIHDELPAPKVLNYSADGEWDNAVDGPDKGVPHFTRIPLMTRSQYQRIGAWPEIDYGADVWLSEKGRTVGIETRMIHSYQFIHHWEQVGRIDTPERLAHSHHQLEELRAGL
jgi:hypothetical protein